MNKKGLDISLNFVIIAALALIALIVIALIFTGGIERITTEEEEILELGTQEKALAEATCKLACTTGSEAAWKSPDFTEEVALYYDDCDDLMTGLGQSGYWQEHCT